jgi:aquaporin related protein
VFDPKRIAAPILTILGVWYTGGSLNPARSFGPDVVLGTFDGYHWIYWIGPLLGAVLAVIFYRLIKTLEYETANPGADADGHELHDYHGSQGQTEYDDSRATSEFQPRDP